MTDSWFGSACHYLSKTGRNSLSWSFAVWLRRVGPENVELVCWRVTVAERRGTQARRGHWGRWDWPRVRLGGLRDPLWNGGDAATPWRTKMWCEAEQCVPWRRQLCVDFHQEHARCQHHAEVLLHLENSGVSHLHLKVMIKLCFEIVFSLKDYQMWMQSIAYLSLQGQKFSNYFGLRWTKK